MEETIRLDSALVRSWVSAMWLIRVDKVTTALSLVERGLVQVLRDEAAEGVTFRDNNRTELRSVMASSETL